MDGDTSTSEFDFESEDTDEEITEESGTETDLDESSDEPDSDSGDEPYILENDSDEDDEDDDEDDEDESDLSDASESLKEARRAKRRRVREMILPEDKEIVTETSTIENGADYMERRYMCMKQFANDALRICQSEITQVMTFENLQMRPRAEITKKDIDFVRWTPGFDDLILSTVALQLLVRFVDTSSPLTNPVLVEAYKTNLNNVSRLFAVSVLLDTTRAVAVDALDEVACNLCACEGSSPLEKASHMRVECVRPNVYEAVFDSGVRVTMPIDDPQTGSFGNFLYIFWDMFECIGRYIQFHPDGFDATPTLDIFTEKVGPRVLGFIHLSYKTHMDRLCFK